MTFIFKNLFIYFFCLGSPLYLILNQMSLEGWDFWHSSFHKGGISSAFS